ncbi:DPBB and LysM peptidoglycan-binding domain-containing protein [Jiulongibacter sediminis]|uniref:LysM domain-containing protein n=1 Tax=Jiulongibacter sediminis TaxID=1605367 RepID=A0A0P7C516_9BACT|nr:LysM peptidoglycan-binding domain-containing protein [Jiulongibacter sediminis]KPM49823.1 hypothetical protein AFM12_04410 [Jiulongibacter sediminis]TBX26860.1 hypothetical protein TK44_04415 [Jiulongibacter sediminis]
MKTITFTFALSLFLLNAHAFKTATYDSLGTKSVNEATYIIHKVQPKETLYSLLRRYDCSSADFHRSNPELGGGHSIKVNQLLRFPTLATVNTSTNIEASRSFAEANLSEEPSKEINRAMTAIHRVEPGQTLFSISQMYGMNIDAIKQLNGLPDNEISIGQSLRIKTTEKNYNDVSAGLYPPNLTPDIHPDIEIVPNAPRGEEVTELGIAEVISGTRKGSNKMLALHKTAPLGSLMVIQNEATKNQVVVKVIGKLPETGNNENILVRLSPNAFYKLNPKDIRIRAKVTYYLPPSS